MEPVPSPSTSSRAAASGLIRSQRHSTSYTTDNSRQDSSSRTHSRSGSTSSISSAAAGTRTVVFIKELEVISSQSRKQHGSSQETTSNSLASGHPDLNTTEDGLRREPYQEPNRCYICFGTEDDSVGRWVKPCQCTLISHEDCLLDWIDKNRQQFARRQVRCSVCNTVYRLTEPNSMLLKIYSTFDAMVHAGIPYLTFLGLTCSVFITSTTYGAYAVLTVCGTEEGERLLGSPNPWGWRVWTGLPLIPVILIFSRTRLIDSFMPLIPLLIVGNDQLIISFPPTPALTLSLIPWARIAYNSVWSELSTRLEKFWRSQHGAGAGAGSSRLGSTGSNVNVDRIDADSAAVAGGAVVAEEDISFFDRKDLGRTIVGALLMPAISSICGSMLGHFPFIRARLPDNFHRNILGGCLFVLVKDLAKLVGTYQELKRRRDRRVREYEEFKNEH
ncbi:hypothetical protein BGW38_008398 [Lunasporangiospora selenospora]|uniref:RING-CH-type domain-containing protein n=1 Tax=Lunasporangiospora selenospora TaxID=979761 RepID=A0A9P6KGJ7_9FUNG|nr:hypothetical protein BGW38_008398 [Lunasporangiospora selenospora]